MEQLQMTQGVVQTIDVMETGNMVQGSGDRVQELESLGTTDFTVILNESEGSQDKPSIDSLLATAQEEGEGFEQVLEKISEGEFELDENESEAIDSEQTQNVVESEESIEEKEGTEEEKVLSPEELQEKLQVIDVKADQILSETQEISQKLDQLSGEVSNGRQEFLEMLLLLYKKIKEEENKTKKISFFELMLRLVGTFMQSLADPEVLDKNLEKALQEPQTVSPHEGSDNMISMIEYLEKKGALRNINPKAETIPTPETPPFPVESAA